MKLIRIIRQLFCRHAFTPNKFQALNAYVHGYAYDCMKCGRREYAFPARVIRKEGEV